MSRVDAQSSSSLWKDAWIRLSRNRMAVIGGAVLLTLGLLSLFAPWIAPYKYETQNLELGASEPQLEWETRQLVYGACTQERARVLAEGYEGKIGILPTDWTELHRTIDAADHGHTVWIASASGDTNLMAMVVTSKGFETLEEKPKRANFILLESRGHLLGTDELGRDLFTRILYGGRISLMVGLCATAVSLTIGVLFGAIAGFFGGRVDDLMMRFVDILYALPFTIFVILLTVIFERNIWNLFLAIGLSVAIIIIFQLLVPQQSVMTPQPKEETTLRDSSTSIDQEQQITQSITKTKEEVMNTLQDTGIPAGAVLDCGPEAYSDPQLNERNFFQIVDHPDAGIYPMSGPIFRFQSDKTEPKHMPSPCLGQHNDYILGELMGYSDHKISVLENTEVIGNKPLIGSDLGGSRRFGQNNQDQKVD